MKETNYLNNIDIILYQTVYDIVNNQWIISDQGETFNVLEVENLGKKGVSKSIGGNAVCYLAHKRSFSEVACSGRLKEIYPAGIDCKRNEDHLLIPQDIAFYDKYVKHCENTKKTYSKIMDMRNQQEGKILNNFIPDFEFYIGKVKKKDLYVCSDLDDEDGEQLVPHGLYIWYGNDWEGITFEDYLRSIRRNDGKSAIKKVSNIMKIVYSLAQRIKVMHELGLVHMDIKPSNFLLSYIDKTNGIVNPNQISVFDLDAIRKKGLIIKNHVTNGNEDAEISSEDICYTPQFLNGGFMSKAIGGINIQLDHYAIARTLLYALDSELWQEENDRVKLLSNDNNYACMTSYSIEKFKNPKHRGSLIKKACLSDTKKSLEEKEKDKELFMKLLVKVINRCHSTHHPASIINDVDFCYDTDEELLEDLKELVDIISRLDRHEFALTSSEDHSEKCKLAIQTEFYNNPLHDYLLKDSIYLDFVMFGFGEYGKDFFATAFEMSQMLNKKNEYVVPRFKIFTQDKILKDDGKQLAVVEDYISNHPSLKRFAKIYESNLKDVITLYESDKHTKVKEISTYENLGDDYKPLAIIEFIKGNIETEPKNKGLAIKNINQICDKILEKDSKNFVDYDPAICFVALGNDDVNQKICTEIRMKLDEKRNDYYDGLVRKIAKNNKNRDEQIDKINSLKNRKRRYYFAKRDFSKNAYYRAQYPIYICVDIKKESYDEFVRMAFNTHLIWKTNLIYDINKEYQSFINDDYCLTASFSNAITLRYKLYNADIVEDDLLVAALKYEENVLPQANDDNDTKNKKEMLLKKIAVGEHRRWLAEFTCRGFNGFNKTKDRNKVYEFLNGNIRKNDKVNPPIHICMEQANEDFKLSDIDGNINFAECKKDIKMIKDPLDKASVAYHNEWLRLKNESECIDFSVIDDQMFASDDELSRLHQQYLYIVNLIKNDGYRYAKLYDTYYTNFIEGIKNSKKANKEYLKASLEHVHKQFEPILKSYEYTDYKINDLKIIKNIPFILTYRTDLHLATTLLVGNKNQLFENVATLNWIRPASVTYFYHVDGYAIYGEHYKHFNEIKEALEGMKKYCAECKISSTMNLELLCTNMSMNQINNLEMDIFNYNKKQKENKVNIKLILFKADDGTCIASTKESKIEQVSCNKTIGKYMFDKLNDPNFKGRYYFQYHFDVLSSYLYQEKMKVKEHKVIADDIKEDIKINFNIFRFDSVNNKLIDSEGILKFIPNRSYLRVFDAFRLANAYECNIVAPQHFKEYEMIWDIYKSGKAVSGGGNYKTLVNKLAKGSRIVDISHTFAIPESKKLKTEKMEYILPNYTLLSVKTILYRLVNLKVVTSFDIKYNQQSTYHLDITYIQNPSSEITNKDKLKSLLSNITLLSNPEEIIFETKRSDTLDITLSSLKGCLESKEDLFDVDSECEVLDKNEQVIFNKLVDNKLIANVKEELCYFVKESKMMKKNRIYFDYVTMEIKMILNKVGAILEYYLYKQLIELKYFDDIVSCEVSWNEGTLLNEFDAVLTKGNRMMIVECKLTKNEVDYYYRLNSLNQEFGINSCGVMLVENTGTKLLEVRGKQANIYTVGIEKCSNIAEELKNIMEDEIKKEE